MGLPPAYMLPVEELHGAATGLQAAGGPGALASSGGGGEEEGARVAAPAAEGEEGGVAGAPAAGAPGVGGAAAAALADFIAISDSEEKEQQQQGGPGVRPSRTPSARGRSAGTGGGPQRLECCFEFPGINCPPPQGSNPAAWKPPAADPWRSSTPLLPPGFGSTPAPASCQQGHTVPGLHPPQHHQQQHHHQQQLHLHEQQHVLIQGQHQLELHAWQQQQVQWAQAGAMHHTEQAPPWPYGSPL